MIAEPNENRHGITKELNIHYKTVLNHLKTKRGRRLGCQKSARSINEIKC